MIIAAMTFERVMNAILSFITWGSPFILFIVFLILLIVNLVKLKKGKGKKGLVITFGVLTAVSLTYCIGEILLVGMLAAAVAHM